MNDQIEWRVSAPVTRSQRSLLETLAREGETARSTLMQQAGVERGGLPTVASRLLYEDYKRLRRMGLVMQRTQPEQPIQWLLTDLGRQIAAAMFRFEPARVD